MGLVARIEINEGIDRYAYKKGLFVIKPSGDTVEIVNDEQFKPGVGKALKFLSPYGIPGQSHTKVNIWSKV